jgi:CheY-like chemotaxis protein
MNSVYNFGECTPEKNMNQPHVPEPGKPAVVAERYRSLVENIQDYAILMLDTAGHVISWNLGAETMKGYTPEEIIGLVPVLGDAVRLTQAVVNLLNNAAKYTPVGGKIGLSVSVRGAELELRVKDNGRGIERDMLEKVFDLFVQIDASSNAALGGLGVGLALVRRVLELHGGSIQARSEGNERGSEFIARMPLSIQQIRIITTAQTQEEAAIHSLRVLVVDDNKDAGDTLDLLLQSMGQQVRTVYDGPSAIATAQTFKPDIVLLDIGMPRMSGYEVARAIQSMPADPRPVLVAVTGWGQESDKARATEAGFRYHFVKPINENVLCEILAQVAAQRPGSFN